LGAGAAAGAVLVRQPARPGPVALVLGALGAAALTGLCAAALCWLGGGGLGSGRLARVGAPPVAVGLRAGAWVLAALLLALGAVAARGRRLHLHRPASAAGAEPAQTGAGTSGDEEAEPIPAEDAATATAADGSARGRRESVG
ncbi:MAG: DUF6350 family protein, partial [Frankiaceae bacterium]|nr:DUF6350 family protein [Frankiaceae bacterium]